MAWAPDYCSMEELAEFMGETDSNDYSILGPAISAASRIVDRFCRRQFGQLSTSKPWFYTPRFDSAERRWYIAIDDLQSVAGLLVETDLANDGSYSTNVTDYILRPRNATDIGAAWTEIYFPGVSPSLKPEGVRVTAKWGWMSVPTAVKHATLLQASRLTKRRDAPFGVAGSPTTGSEVRLLAKVDPDVEVTLTPYRRYQQEWA